MIKTMTYPSIPNFKQLADDIILYTQLQSEYGARGISSILSRAEKALCSARERIKKLPMDPNLAKKEPSDLPSIHHLRPDGPRRLWKEFRKEPYAGKLTGALLGRMAGCTLGAPVEFWPIDKMKALAGENGEKFPPTDYWRYVPEPERKRYGTSRRDEYTRIKMKCVPADDDLAYTLLGLLIVEDFGPAFTVGQVGKAWQKYLPMACTAEKIALQNLKQGCPASRAGAKNNPYCEWIGADIRADPWAYLAPGWPAKAAELAWRDAFISHRRQGIYGEMFFAAAVSAAFAVNDPIEALRIGLTEIPGDCQLSHAVRWALRVAPKIHNYQQARDRMEAKFKGMHPVHTINNACLTIWGLTIGGKDFTRVIGETVAMGMDNDCTAATAGSIFGAAFGKKAIPGKWFNNFNNTIRTYLIKKKTFAIDDVIRRFTRQAQKIHGQNEIH